MPQDRELEKVIDGTESVVPLAARYDLRFARQELVDGDIEHVRAGMELMVWSYDETEWERHVKASGKRVAASSTGEGDLASSLLFGKHRRGWVIEQLRAVPLPTVVITSTGILFGELARPWRGRRRRLTAARVEKRDPKYLVLSFATRWAFIHWATRELWVPIPKPLEGDAGDVADTLNGWLERGKRGPAPTPR